MKARYYSMSEIAEKTGTSRQVISAILNNNWREKRISKKTFDRVSRAMDDIGYVPDRTAISLRKENRKSIGIVCHGPLYSHMLVALEKLNHYFLDSEESIEMHISSEGELTEAVRALMGHRVESLIILISPMLENFGIRDLKDVNLHKLLRAVPHLIYNFPFDVHEKWIEDKYLEIGSHLIGFSRKQAYLPFLEHLVEQNLKNILIDEKIFSILKKGSKTSQILSTFNNIEIYSNPQSGRLAENTFRIGEVLAEILLPSLRAHPFDYILTFSDGIAQGVACRLEDYGIKIPYDLRILGFDKVDALKYFKYPISSIEVPVDEMIQKTIFLCEERPSQNQSYRTKTKLYL